MSAIGQSPKVQWLNLVPKSADPSDPEDGDIFYSDGTSRTEGPWVYQNGAWAQFSTGAAITVVDDLTLTPQAADPGSPTEGMLFYADGTSRAAGLWAYNGTDWVQVTGVRYQEFAHKTRFTVRAASTANVTLANQVENGDSFGGVTLATNDLVLLKNQTDTTENGVYVVQVSGAPVRSTSYDDATELTYAQVFVSSGTNANTVYYQTAVLSTLADAQTWSTTPPTYSFTVPEGVYEVSVDGLGPGGPGGPGGNGNGSTQSGTGGGGGAGTILSQAKLKVTPGNVLSIYLGRAGYSTTESQNSTVTGADDVSLFFPAGARGTSGSTGVSASVAGASTYIQTTLGALGPLAGGNSGTTGSGGGQPGSTGASAASTSFILGGPITPATGGSGGTGGGGANGASGGGGGGSSSFGPGGNGGNGATHATHNATAGSSTTNYGAGGGGGGGRSAVATGTVLIGGHPGESYVRISW